MKCLFHSADVAGDFQFIIFHDNRDYDLLKYRQGTH